MAVISPLDEKDENARHRGRKRKGEKQRTWKSGETEVSQASIRRADIRTKAPGLKPSREPARQVGKGRTGRKRGKGRQ